MLKSLNARNPTPNSLTSEYIIYGNIGFFGASRLV